MTDHPHTQASPGESPATEPHPSSRGLHRLLDRVERISGVVFILVVLLNFASAAGRYAAGAPILGADEVQVFTMIWLIFVGAAIAALRRAHLRMDVLTAYLSPRLAWWRHLCEALLMVAACALMVWVSCDFTYQIYSMEQKSDAAEIPMWLPHLSVVVGFVGMLLCSLLELKTLLTQRLGSSTHA